MCTFAIPHTKQKSKVATLTVDAERNAEREEPVRGEIVISPPNGRSRREPPLHGKWYGECPWSIFVEVSHIAFLTE